MSTCPTCQRMPSERHPSKAQYGENRATRFAHPCPDPIHDLADRCVELDDWLGQLANYAGSEDTPEDQADVDTIGRVISDMKDGYLERVALQARVAELEGRTRDDNWTELLARLEGNSERGAILGNVHVHGARCSDTWREECAALRASLAEAVALLRDTKVFVDDHVGWKEMLARAEKDPDCPYTQHDADRLRKVDAFLATQESHAEESDASSA